ncbi:MAG: hypothetical protein Q4P34_02915 [Tissierellia bacterium]|nr:hypothetical protein [Tissierellia bacterium]
MKVVNWIIDTVYDLFEYLIMLLVVVAAIFIILWRLELMFGSNLSIIAKPSEVVESTLKTTKESVSQILGSSSLEGEKIDINIPEGTSAEGIANILYEYELISDKEVFRKKLLEKIENKELPKGKYDIKIGSTEEELIEILTK